MQRNQSRGGSRSESLDGSLGEALHGSLGGVSRRFDRLRRADSSARVATIRLTAVRRFASPRRIHASVHVPPFRLLGKWGNA